MRMTTTQRMTRYRWGFQVRAALEKAARLVEARPEGKELPLLPKALIKAYKLKLK